MKKTNSKKNNNLHKLLLVVIAITVITLPRVALAQDIGNPDLEVIKGLYPGNTYSPRR